VSNGTPADSLPAWITTGIVTMIVAMAGGIVGLFKLMRSDAAAQLASHDRDIIELKTQAAADRESAKQEVAALQQEARECRKDREQLKIALAQLEIKVIANKKLSDANHEADKQP
jgi:uncharacterized membrane protein